MLARWPGVSTSTFSSRKTPSSNDRRSPACTFSVMVPRLGCRSTHVLPNRILTAGILVRPRRADHSGQARGELPQVNRVDVDGPIRLFAGRKVAGDLPPDRADPIAVGAGQKDVKPKMPLDSRHRRRGRTQDADSRCTLLGRLRSLLLLGLVLLGLLLLSRF